MLAEAEGVLQALALLPADQLRELLVESEREVEVNGMGSSMTNSKASWEQSTPDFLSSGLRYVREGTDFSVPVPPALHAISKLPYR